MLIKVMLVSHLPPLRLGIATGLAQEEEIQVVGEADTDGRALALAKSLRPDVILLDASLPGPEIQTLIRKLAAFSKVVVLDRLEGDHPIDTYMNAGAMGCVQRCEDLSVIISVIRKVVASPQAVLSPVSKQRLAEAWLVQGERPRVQLTETWS